MSALEAHNSSFFKNSLYFCDTMKIANIQKVRTKTVRDISQPGTISSEIIISIAAIKPNKSASNPAFNEGEKSINRRSKLADIANANATTLRGCALSKICKRLFASNWNLKNVHHYYKKEMTPIRASA
jgi:hypothetical protein